MNLDKLKLPLWLQSLVASLGGVGIFCVGFLDSSFLTFPIINDLLVIHLSIKNPARMPYYAFMATLGSVLGSFVLYLVAKKGGEAMFRRHARGYAGGIRRWFAHNSFLAVGVPSVLPPPLPFKAFVVAAGVFQVRKRVFIAALSIGRGFRYLLEGYLAIRYGEQALDYLKQNKLQFTAIVLGFILVSYLIARALHMSGDEEEQEVRREK